MNNKKITKLTSTILLTTMLAYTTPILAFSKEETVYSKINTKGENYKTIVSTHLLNDNEEQMLNDLTDLINLENTNGNEEFRLDGENVIWNANGSDIYYQGESQKELPIECNIKYELNGEEISADEIAGKSGSVKITIEYKNNDEHQVTINGRKQTMYTPFTAICMSYFDNSQNKNIEAKNAKVINDGTKTIITGIAMPGMNESLNISNKKIEIPSKVEITMETSKFEQNNIITFVTPKILDESISFDKLNSLYKKVDEIMEASKQIEDGANALKEGTTEFSEKSQEFNDGMKALEAGTNKLNTGVQDLDKGATDVNSGATKLSKGATELSNGVKELNIGAKNLNAGAKQLSSGTEELQKGVKTGKDKAVQTLTQSSKTLANGIDKIITGKDTETNTIKEMVIENGNNTLKQKLTPAVAEGTKKIAVGTVQEVLKDYGVTLTDEQIKEIMSKIDTSVLEKSINTAIDTASKQEQAGIDAINNNENGVKAGLNTLKAQAGASITTGIKELGKGFDDISNGVGSLNDGATKLEAGTKGLYDGTGELLNGSNELANGAKELNNGTTALSTGSKQIKQGLNTLKESTTILVNGSNALTEGAETINKGSVELAEGITTFNQEAINKICEFVNSDIKEIALRAEKLQELSEEYKNFSKANENTAKEVKFILISDSVKEKEKKSENE